MPTKTTPSEATPNSTDGEMQTLKHILTLINAVTASDRLERDLRHSYSETCCPFSVPLGQPHPWYAQIYHGAQEDSWYWYQGVFTSGVPPEYRRFFGDRDGLVPPSIEDITKPGNRDGGSGMDYRER
ncbi:MAG: hypothetical protein Q9162_001329 [Coniocarpon cinnabarinum]